jgi:diadenosine tetraphosphate (Ap4A) HIT family hydrolase
MPPDRQVDLKVNEPTRACIFCTMAEVYLCANELAYAIADKFPAAPGHSLIIPRRHMLTLDDASEDEVAALFGLLKKTKVLIREKYGADGFNIGINEGISAGQTVMHLHIHIIPRISGDVSDPRGGIRKVLPCRHRYPFG